MPRLTFFGYDLSARGLAPCKEKVAAVVNAGAPKDAAKVRSFLDLVQYTSKFLPDYALVAEPLRELTRKNVKFRWGVKQQEAFAKMKMINERQTLAYFKSYCRTRIFAEACPHGLEAVLMQQQDGVWRVVSYTSRSLTEVERRYSQTEKEALALVWACKCFNIYIYARKFKLETIAGMYYWEDLKTISMDRAMGASSARLWLSDHISP